MKGIHNNNANKQIESSYYMGRLDFRNFIQRQPDSGTDSLIVILYEVIRQDDQEFQDILCAMRNGSMIKYTSDFLLSLLLVRLSIDERETFDDALHIMPQWKMIFPITVSYLRHLDLMVSKLTFEYSPSNSTAANHAVRDCNYPRLNALDFVANIMLLRNYVVELCLMNGSVGTITHIIYEERVVP